MQKNFRYIARLTLAFIKRFKGLLALSITIGLLLSFVISKIFILFPITSVSRIAVVGRFHAEEIPVTVLSQVGDGLTKISGKNIVEPNLAKEYNSTDGGKTWKFILRDNIYWHDGDPVTSDDINYEFSDVKIEKPDSKTIIFTLQDKFSPFPSVVAKPIFKRGLIGTGNWQVDKINLVGGSVASLTLVNQSDNKERKIYKFYPTIELAKLAYKMGEVDEIDNMLNPSPFDSWKTVKVDSKINENAITTLFFNVSDPILSDKSIRQALAYLIDKDDYEFRATGPIPQNHWAYNSQVKKYPYDKERGEELLANQPDNENGLVIKLVTNPDLLDVAESIAEDWRQSGVSTTVLVSSVIPNDFQVYLTIFIPPDDPDQYSLWHSTQTNTNISKLVSPRIDKLLEEGRIETDSQKRIDIYFDFQRFLLEEVPAVFLYYPQIYSATRL